MEANVDGASHRGLGWGVCIISSATDGLVNGKIRLETGGYWTAAYVGKRTRKCRLHFQPSVEDYGTVLVTFTVSVCFCGMSFPALLAGHLTWTPFWMSTIGNCQAQRIFIPCNGSAKNWVCLFVLCCCYCYSVREEAAVLIVPINQLVDFVFAMVAS